MNSFVISKMLFFRKKLFPGCSMNTLFFNVFRRRLTNYPQLPEHAIMCSEVLFFAASQAMLITDDWRVTDGLDLVRSPAL